MALALAAIAAVVALNVAVVAPAATVTDAGTVSEELVLASAILAPPAGADWVKVTLHVLDEFGPRLAGLHESEETSTEAARLIAAVAELPLKLAVIVTV